jgi:hypothetical protein
MAKEDMEHTTPTKDEIKLIIDNSLLELEKRMTKSLGESLSEQNRMYMDNILSLSERVTKIESRQDRQDERIKGFKGLIATIAAASSVVAGFLGFLISQITQR